MDGLTTTRHWRGKEARVPAIRLTGDVYNGACDAGLAAGCLLGCLGRDREPIR